MPDQLAEAQALAARMLQQGNACFTCSFQAEDMVVLDILRQQKPDIPVIFLETGYHFAETIAYRDEIARAWNLNLANAEAVQSRAAQESQFGILYTTDPGRCCDLRKVAPLRAELAKYEVWFTGLRREQSPTRAGLQEVEQHRLPTGEVLQKVSLLAGWTWGEVSAYMAVREIPWLPLYDQGYTSIGCEPCTAKPAPGEDARSGRWGGKKLECGIHTFTETGARS